jgi:hypothetical protein
MFALAQALEARTAIEKALASNPGALSPSGWGGSSYGSVTPQAATDWNQYYSMSSATLPRDWRTFLSGAFGPLEPIQPVAIDVPDQQGTVEPRRWNYPISWNMPIGQPGDEGINLASFAQLRGMADYYSVARACIRVRKQEIQGLDWDIVPTDDAEKNMQGSQGANSDFMERRAKALQFFKRPDPDNYIDFHTWLGALLEELFVTDALAIYLQPSTVPGKGPFGSSVAALALLDGSTIRPLLDIKGGRPRPPNPCYQQFIAGIPRVDMMDIILGTDLEDMDAPEQEYSARQLVYLPYTRRVFTPYGFPNVEQCLVPQTMGLQRQGTQLEFFTQGTIPGLFLTPGPDIATPQQVRLLQNCFDAETEVLTDQGWKFWPDTNGSEKFASRSASGEFQWQSPLQMHKVAYNGDMIVFKNRTVDQMMTPNHRVLTRRVGEAEWRFVEAGEFIPQRSKKGINTRLMEIPMTSTGWNGSEEATFILEPQPGLAGGQAHRVQMPMVDFCRFLGVFLAEGWTSKGTQNHTGTRRPPQILVSQGPFSEGFHEIEQILKATGLKWTYYPRSDGANSGTFITSSRLLWDWLQQCGRGSENKSVPPFIKNLSTPCLEALLDGHWLGDGAYGKPDENGYYKARRHVTTSPQLRDDLQEIFQKCGRHASYTVVPPSPPNVWPNGQVCVGHLTKYDVRERFRVPREETKTLARTCYRFPRAKTIHYDGFVYCATVPNSTLYVRRNGKAAWSGNTLNALAGDSAWKHRIIVLPAGSSTQDIKPPPLADGFDDLLYTQVAMGFDVMPHELGIQPGNASGHAGGQSTIAHQSSAINERKSLKPLLQFLKESWFDFVLQTVFKQTDMQFSWVGLEQGEDANDLSDRMIKEIGTALTSIDEARVEMGKQPWGLLETAMPIFVTAQGGVPVSAQMVPGEMSGLPEAVQVMLEEMADEQQSQQDAQNAAQGSPMLDGNGMPVTDANGSPLDQTGTSMGAPPVPGQTSQVNPQAPQVNPKVVLAEIEKVRRHLKKGQALDTWRPFDIPQPLWSAMCKADDPVQSGRNIVQAHQKRATRDAAVAAIAAASAASLGALARRLRAGQLSSAGFVDQGTAVLQNGFSQTYAISKQHAQAYHNIDDDDDEDDDLDDLAAMRAGSVAAGPSDQGQRGFLTRFAATLLAAPSVANLTARLNMYVSNLYNAYEEGWGRTVGKGAPVNNMAQWVAKQDASTCDNCGILDGQVFTVATLPGFPGAGPFGGTTGLCEGAINCRCTLVWFKSDQDQPTLSPEATDMALTKLAGGRLNPDVPRITKAGPVIPIAPYMTERPQATVKEAPSFFAIERELVHARICAEFSRKMASIPVDRKALITTAGVAAASDDPYLWVNLTDIVTKLGDTRQPWEEAAKVADDIVGEAVLRGVNIGWASQSDPAARLAELKRAGYTVTSLRKYSDDEPRDDRGRFTSGGSSVSSMVPPVVPPVRQSGPVVHPGLTVTPRRTPPAASPSFTGDPNVDLGIIAAGQPKPRTPYPAHAGSIDGALEQINAVRPDLRNTRANQMALLSAVGDVDPETGQTVSLVKPAAKPDAKPATSPASPEAAHHENRLIREWKDLWAIGDQDLHNDFHRMVDEFHKLGTMENDTKIAAVYLKTEQAFRFLNNKLETEQNDNGRAGLAIGMIGVAMAVGLTAATGGLVEAGVAAVAAAPVIAEWWVNKHQRQEGGTTNTRQGDQL